MRTKVLSVGALVLMATSAAAQTHSVHLVAAPLSQSITLPNGTAVSVPMWGFALDANANGILDPGEAPSVPGPRLSVPPGTTLLSVTVTNQLPAPVSFVIPGQAFSAAPVRRADGRIVSMTAEAPPGGTQRYDFPNLRPGTFLYQSGTHQAVQVQMGLYGALTHDAGAGEAYPGLGYDSDVVLLYSEVDVALHQSVDAGTYGRPELGGPTSTIGYAPSLFLINGESYANELHHPQADAGVAGRRTLVRFLNAGLRTHVPIIDNGSLRIVGEDGNPYPFARTQATLLLAAGKTHDVIWTPASPGVFPVYDRALSLQAEDNGSAGMLAMLSVAQPPPDPGDPPPTGSEATARPDSFAGLEDVPLVVAAGGVLANDDNATSAQLVTSPESGTLTLAANGSFTYQPAANFFGVVGFTYRAVNAGGSSDAVAVTIAIAPAADLPIAEPVSVGVTAREFAPVTLSGTDPDGDPIDFYIAALAQHGTLSIVDPLTSVPRVLGAGDVRTASNPGTLIPSGIVIYTPDPGVSGGAAPYSGMDGASFVASDTTGVSAPAAVAITVHPLEASAARVGNPLGLHVMGTDGSAISGYRWTLEEDRTYDVLPGVADPNTLAVNFHASYMPVVQKGDETTVPIVDPARRYFVSVLPKTGSYTNGGGRVERGQTDLTVMVTAGALPTAQVRVRVFHDNAPLDGAWSAEEPGLANFEVTLEDAGGRYGMSAAQQLMDAFGNQLGTVYGPCSTASCTSLEIVRPGSGFVLTDADGYALIQNLPPGKYGVKVRAPGGTTWVQTSTIEGTRTIDAWVKANEPLFFAEFGPPGPHAFVGFTQPMRDTNVLGAGAGPFSTVTGSITNLRMSRPPSAALFGGGPYDYTQPWVALNTGPTGGTLLYAQPTDEDGAFTISGVPSGSYQLVVFDSALDIIIAKKIINVSAPDNLALGDVPVFGWFTRLYNFVFEDTNENGFKDAGEVGIPEQAINLRWRDGSMYQSSATDGSGFVPFEEIFPFFSWQVAEVDYLRMKATGVTVVVDAGGNSLANPTWPAAVGADVDPRVLAPEPQPENGGAPFRTETGPVLVQAFQGFIGQTSVMLWGKAPFAPAGSITQDVNHAPFDVFDPADPLSGDIDANGNGRFDVDQFHGGVSGIVHYGITRAENDPRWGAAEVWEPGVPRVRVQLWDVTRTKLLNEVTTDSWDDSRPEGCQGAPFTYLGRQTDCFDGLRNFNQVRPGVFDGGYAFMTLREPFVGANGLPVPVDERTIEKPLPAGRYIVKIVVPEGYSLVKEEDKNVDFGEEYIPQEFYLTGYPLGDPGSSDPAPASTAAGEPLAAPFCVGTSREVPAELALFPGVAGTYAGEQRPLCDAKLVTLRDGQNPGANFFLFTEAPIAGHIVGFVLDDTTNEFDPNSPQFGEKYAPPFLPIAIRDWTGREITRTRTDRYGVYNVLVPSTFTANAPIPSGMSPNMLTACINAPLKPGPNGTMVPDPEFNKQYSHFCYTMPFMPGTTTYLDTPVVPTSAFTGADQFPVDAELPAGTPEIASVNGTALGLGPYIVDRGPTNNAARRIQITSAGTVQVPNPLYDGVAGTQPKLIARDHGFGPSNLNGTVKLGGRPINVSAWSNQTITAVVPTGLDFRTGQLTVERCIARDAQNVCMETRESVLGVTLTVANLTLHTQRPPKTVGPGQSIQSIIDSPATQPGDLILVAPGAYEEMVVMAKPVRLQGWGAGSTVINSLLVPSEKFQDWRNYVGTLLAGNPDYLLADQTNILGPAPFLDAAVAAAIGGEGAGITVFARNQASGPLGSCLLVPGTTSPANAAFCLQDENPGGIAVRRPNARIDGLSIMGSSQAPGVMVNAYARFLEVGNNRVYNNYGDFAGGISVGHAGGPLPLVDEDAQNSDIRIHHNMITQNAGSSPQGGGGIVIGTGSDRYQVTDNFIAGNYTAGQGAGVSHIGLSRDGVIDRNMIVFNESFNQGIPVAGGGLFVGGRPPVLGGLTPGSGSVRISNNLIQGNQAASGDGGGIALSGVNGQDVLQFQGPVDSLQRYRVSLFNNIISNNVAALAGGGLAIQDAPYVEVVHSTLVHNDSLATSGGAFTTSPDQSVPQPAGIVSRGHSPGLNQALGAGSSPYSDPLLVNSILWQNRSFFFGPLAGGVQVPGDPNPAPVSYGLSANPSTPFWDLGVLGAPAGSAMHPAHSVLTSTSGYAASNITAAPSFVASYFNGNRNPTIVTPEVTVGIQAPAAFDEGGNFIRPLFGPLSLTNAQNAFHGNYHVTSGVVGNGLNVLYGGVASVPEALLFDIDRQPRPAVLAGVTGPHRGADQVRLTTPLPPAPPAGAIAVTGPSMNATVGGNVTLYAMTPGMANVARVDFLVNGTVVGSDTTSSQATYSVVWNSRSVPDSPPQAVITAIAYDAALNPTTSSAVNVYVRNAGLVASFDFNETDGTTVLDAAVGGVTGDAANDGTFPGIGMIGRMPDRSAVSGGALAFAGGAGGLITVPDANSLDLTRMTVSAWVRPDVVEGWQSLILKERPGNLVYGLYANSDLDGPSAYIRVGGFDHNATSGAALSAGGWHHVAATYDGTRLRLYVDGLQTASFAVSGSIAGSARPLFIGGNTVWGEFFTGLIDDVTIYNRALSAGEIATAAGR